MFTTTVIAPFLKSVRLQPNETCLDIGGHKYTNAAFVQFVAPIMNELDTLNDSVVMLLMEEDVQSYAALFACLLTGKTVVPVSASWSEAQRELVRQNVATDTLLSRERMQYYFRMTVEDAICRIDNGLYQFTDSQVMVRCFSFTPDGLREESFTSEEITRTVPPHPIHLFRFFTDKIAQPCSTI
ncbi:MAG: hypothetical protein J6T59_04590 [Bacteroidales bacterium]|nr:hypothetical protein [Bacteroidales bacterium]